MLASVRTLGSATSSSRVSTSAKALPSTSCHLHLLTTRIAPPPSLLTGSSLAQFNLQLDATFSQVSSSSFLLRQLLLPPPCWGCPTGPTTLPPLLLWAFRTSFSGWTASLKICPLAQAPGTPCLPPAFSPGIHCPALLSPALPSLYCLQSPPVTQLLSLGTLFAPFLQHLSRSPRLLLLLPHSRPPPSTHLHRPSLPTLRLL